MNFKDIFNLLFGKNDPQIENETIKGHAFLAGMYQDSYFPAFLVDKGVKILKGVCYQIEKKSVRNLDELYKITHVATKKINQLEHEFGKHGSEIETVARECIAMEFGYIAKAYGFENADLEELIAPREW